MKSLHPHPQQNCLRKKRQFPVSNIFIKFIHEPIIYYFKLILFTIFTEREREIQSSPPPFKLIFSDLCLYFTDVKLYDLYSLSSLT